MSVTQKLITEKINQDDLWSFTTRFDTVYEHCFRDSPTRLDKKDKRERDEQRE